LDNNYINFFEKLGILLIIIPNSTINLEKYFEYFKPDGIILSGGEDVNPDLYGGEKHKSFDISLFRDTTEFILIDYAVKKQIPVFGICRGFQIINVYFGGKLVQDIKELKTNSNHLNPDNHIITVNNQKIISLLNQEQFMVNSYHNQGISFDCLSDQLDAFAVYQKSELLEGIYHKTLPIAAVQWHPERFLEATNLNNLLIESFVNKKLFWENKN